MRNVFKGSKKEKEKKKNKGKKVEIFVLFMETEETY